VLTFFAICTPSVIEICPGAYLHSSLNSRLNASPADASCYSEAPLCPIRH
jgi:hypothetical protein